MPDLAKIQAVTAKLEASSAEANPAPEVDSAAPPDGSASGAGSAPAEGSPAPAKTIDHDELAAKLQADRDRRAARQARKQAEEDRKQAEADRKAAAEEKAKLAAIGKDKPWKEALTEMGRDPSQVWEEMRKEALTAGTPEAMIEQMGRKFTADLQAEREKREAIEKQLEDERKQRDEEKTAAEQRAEAATFERDFQRGLGEEKYAPLLDEYEPQQLFRLAHGLYKAPENLYAWADHLQVPLTDPNGQFTMVDILNVMTALQARHRGYQEQRRNKNAAPQSQPGQEKPAEAKKPTVNGTAARNAGSTLGNQLAATRATDAAPPPRENREQRIKRLEAKYAGKR